MSTRNPFYFSRKNRMLRLCLIFNRKLSGMKFLLPEKHQPAVANNSSNGFWKKKIRQLIASRIFMSQTYTSGGRLVDPYTRHGRERGLVPVHFDHDLSGHVGMLVIPEGIVGWHDGGDAPVLFQP